MKLLVVNPNTTRSVTETVMTEARRWVDPATTLSAVTADFGVTIVSTEAENVIAAHAALDLLATHAAGFDAAVLAISFDAGVMAARTLLPIPVVGITESALHTACLIGRRFGLVVLGGVSLPLYTDLLQRIGLESRLAAIEVAEVGSAAEYLDRESITDRIRRAALSLVAREQVDVIVVCGAATAGIAHHLRPDLPIPILDGIGPAIMQAELLARLAIRPRRTIGRLAAGAPSKGLSLALERLIDRSG